MVDGVLIPVSSCSCITVDFWGKANRNVLAAFLTHAHADHVKGLGNTWNGERGLASSTFTCRWHSKVDAC